MKRLLLPLLAALALPTAVNANVDNKFHELCLPANDYAGCIEFQTNKEKTKVDQNKSAINEIEKGKWQFSNYEDMASGKVAYTALLQSENQFNLSFPYSGLQKGILMVRNHPRLGGDISFSIEQGQILSMDGSYDKKYFLVRFDNDEVEEFRFSGSSSASTDIIFVDWTEKFLEKLLDSKKIYITINLYQDGTKTLIFDVQGLKNWSKLDQKPFRRTMSREHTTRYCKDFPNPSFEDCMDKNGYDP